MEENNFIYHKVTVYMRLAKGLKAAQHSSLSGDRFGSRRFIGILAACFAAAVMGQWSVTKRVQKV